MRILIADKHILFRDGLKSLLAEEPDMEVVGQTDSVQAAVEQAAILKPDLVLMDVQLKDGAGAAALKTIKAAHPQCRVLILSDQDTNENLFEAFRSGANGYVLKDIPIENLLAAMRAAGRGEQVLSRLLTRRLVEEYSRVCHLGTLGAEAFNTLTARELEVLRYLGTGANNRAIAERLIISEHTVKVHVRNILDKLGLKKRSQIVGASLRKAMSPAVGRTILWLMAFSVAWELWSLLNYNLPDGLIA